MRLVKLAAAVGLRFTCSCQRRTEGQSSGMVMPLKVAKSIAHNVVMSATEKRSSPACSGAYRGCVPGASSSTSSPTAFSGYVMMVPRQQVVGRYIRSADAKEFPETVTCRVIGLAEDAKFANLREPPPRNARAVRLP